ncbi:hypothetical protein [Rhodococcus sp. BH5]|uniref:hypothetical protein n=1 Tax=Rhodococcus sp. BH5 TaxID=2871702 RepID=UPI0022CD3383|nr:hypothetical protein [Rhodococcus sp. BH5]MCZ9635176.1 hypothetical protein [Rhodococcus sp. BH5]
MNNNEKAEHAADNSAGSGAQPGKWRIGKCNIIGAAAAVILLLAVGVGAYAAIVADGDDNCLTMFDDRDVSATLAGGQTPDDGRTDAAHGTGELRAFSAAALRVAAEKALDSAKGIGVTSIDIERGGYEVEVQLDDGSELDVFVATDGTVTEGINRPDGERPNPALDLDLLADIVKTAMTASSAAAGAEGTVDAISSSDDPGVAYEVSIRLADGRESGVDLGVDLGVVMIDVDDN